jgi:hypothetical protein
MVHGCATSNLNKMDCQGFLYKDLFAPGATTLPARLASLPACQELARQTGDSVAGRRYIKS